MAIFGIRCAESLDTWWRLCYIAYMDQPADSFPVEALWARHKQLEEKLAGGESCAGVAQALGVSEDDVRQVAISKAHEERLEQMSIGGSG